MDTVRRLFDQRAELQAECERLRAMLNTARQGLLLVCQTSGDSASRSQASIAFRRGDPDAEPESAPDGEPS